MLAWYVIFPLKFPILFGPFHKYLINAMYVVSGKWAVRSKVTLPWYALYTSLKNLF